MLTRCWILLTTLLLLPGCPTLICGAGTTAVDGVCLPSDDDDLTSDDDDATGDDDDATGDDDDSGDDDDATGDDDDATDPVGPIAAPEPPPPTFPTTIDTLSITMVTADLDFAGTDENSLSVCLTASDCFSLDTPDVNDNERGETNVHHYEGVGLPRASVDRVEIRSVNGVDRWEPACMAIQFDGEPMFCSALSGLQFGEESDELQSWMAPNGLALDCTSCDPSVLTHGPMIGAPEPDGGRVWARTDATRLVGLRVSETSDLTSAPVVDWAWTSPTNDYAATLSVDNLAPDTLYWYGVEVDGVLMGAAEELMTAPAPGTATAMSFAFGSCSKADDQPIFGTIAGEDPDYFLFVGDNHYGNTGVVDALRHYYRWALAIPERGALAATTPTMAVWDDHDYVGNNTDATSLGRGNALRVFAEYWANPSVGTATIPGVFFQQSHGDVDFFMLDDRYHRGLDDSILGAAQQQWLMDALSASTATFKFVVTGSQWTADGSGDSWASFVTQRDVIFDHIRDAEIDGVVLMSGDVHRSEFRVIERASAGGYDLPELTSSPLATWNSGCPNEGEILHCFDSEDYVIVVDVDTQVADPTIEARMLNQDGALQATYTTSLSALTVP